MKETDTIAAGATGPGVGAVAIVRISGDRAITIADQIWEGKKKLCALPGYSFAFGRIVLDGRIIDEVLCAVFRAPHSYTGEDTVEINCHGGQRVREMVLGAVIHAGARLAEAGEFSKRAFINGKLDLSQAEAVIDMIQAKGAGSVYNAAGQMAGGIADQINEIRDALLSIHARILAVIDFPDEEIEEWETAQFAREIGERIGQIDKILDGFSVGRLLREGYSVAIVGRTNAGKSSLFNAMLDCQRAIVTDIAGTTRDVVEEMIEIKGLPVRLLDTAGIRETDDIVEQLGVERSKEMIAQSDLVLYVIDGSQDYAPEEGIVSLLQGKDCVLVQNKADLPQRLETMKLKRGLSQTGVDDTQASDMVTCREKGARENAPVQVLCRQGAGIDDVQAPIMVSCKDRTGLDTLFDRIYKMATNTTGNVQNNGPLLSNIRHKQCLEQARQSLSDAQDAISAGIPMDVVSIDIGQACEQLGQVTGISVNEEVVQKIFSQFCVGK